MGLRLPALLRAIVVTIFVVAVLTAEHVRDCSAVVPPCPVATDATIAQMARQWAASFKTPYCEYLDQRNNILLRQKLARGVVRQATALSAFFNVSDGLNDSSILKRVGKATRRVDLKNRGARDAAAAKLRVLRTGVALTTYLAGEKAFVRASRAATVLEEFAPRAFDFSSRHQAQKDAAKLAHLRGLVQAQELRLLSLLKMMDALEEGK